MISKESFLPEMFAFGKDAMLDSNILTSSNCSEVCNYAITAQAGAALQHTLKFPWEHVPSVCGSGWYSYFPARPTSLSCV